MVFENFGQIQEGDLVEAHIMVEVLDRVDPIVQEIEFSDIWF